MIILGIETSCDETSAGIVEDGHKLLSLVTATSMDLHVAYGGVVPEIAARSHIESIIPVIDQALHEAFGQSSTKSEILNSKQTLKSQISNLKSSDPWDQCCRPGRLGRSVSTSSPLLSQTLLRWISASSCPKGNLLCLHTFGEQPFQGPFGRDAVSRSRVLKSPQLALLQR